MHSRLVLSNKTTNNGKLFKHKNWGIQSLAFLERPVPIQDPGVEQRWGLDCDWLGDRSRTLVAADMGSDTVAAWKQGDSVNAGPQW